MLKESNETQGLFVFIVNFMESRLPWKSLWAVCWELYLVVLIGIEKPVLMMIRTILEAEHSRMHKMEKASRALGSIQCCFLRVGVM